MMHTDLEPKEFKRRVGARVRGLRIANTQYTQEQLAEELGLSAATIIRVETGKTELGLITAFKLAREFGVSLDELTGYTMSSEDEPSLVSESGSSYDRRLSAANITFQIGMSGNNTPEQDKFISRLGKLLMDSSSLLGGDENE